jgi:hypothetical protein
MSVSTWSTSLKIADNAHIKYFISPLVVCKLQLRYNTDNREKEQNLGVRVKGPNNRLRGVREEGTVHLSFSLSAL